MPTLKNFQITDVINEIQNEILKVNQPVIWIFKDKFGISSDEIWKIQNSYSSILISDENARLNEKSAIVCSGDPSKSSDKWRIWKRGNRLEQELLKACVREKLCTVNFANLCICAIAFETNESCKMTQTKLDLVVLFQEQTSTKIKILKNRVCDMKNRSMVEVTERSSY